MLVIVKPQCQLEFGQTYYQHLGDFVQLKCYILANPSKNVMFTWKFNGTMFIGDNEPVSDTNDRRLVEHSTLGMDNEPNSKAILSNTLLHSTSTYKTAKHEHLITNIIRIHLKKWNNFGKFSCQAKNSIGMQSEPCLWHIMPYHYHTHYRNNHESFGNAPVFINHRLHNHYGKPNYAQQEIPNKNNQMLLKNWASRTLPNQLNNCHIIESSSIVVIKCLNGVELFEKTDQEEKAEMDNYLNNNNNNMADRDINQGKYMKFGLYLNLLFILMYDTHTRTPLYN